MLPAVNDSYAVLESKDDLGSKGMQYLQWSKSGSVQPPARDE